MKNLFRLSIWLLLMIALTSCDGKGSEAQEAILFPPEGAPVEGDSAITTEEDETVKESCPKLSPHPVAEDIAETFTVEYEQVIEWFCNGQSFEEILLALQTQKITDVEVEVLFNERMSGKSWDQIWLDLEITKP